MCGKIKWIGALLTGILALLCSGVITPAQVSPAAGREGETLPLFTGTTVDGEAFDLKAFARENTTLVFFWDSYKTMAIREMGFLNELYRFYQLYGLEIVAIEGNGRDRDQVREQLEKLKTIGTVPLYTVLPDPGGKLSTQFRIEELPETFLIDRGGKILFHLRGFREKDGDSIEQMVKERLGLQPLPGAPLPAASVSRDLEEPEETPRKKGVTVDPEQQLFEKYRYFGNYHFNAGDMPKALDNYRQCLEIDDRSVEIYLQVGEIYARMKNYEKAREAWERVLQLDPGNREADALIRRLIRGEF